MPFFTSSSVIIDSLVSTFFLSRLLFYYRLIHYLLKKVEGLPHWSEALACRCDVFMQRIHMLVLTTPVLLHLCNKRGTVSRQLLGL